MVKVNKAQGYSDFLSYNTCMLWAGGQSLLFTVSLFSPFECCILYMNRLFKNMYRYFFCKKKMN